jgi:hypothetical protein
MGAFWSYFLDFFGLAWTSSQIQSLTPRETLRQETRTLAQDHQGAAI